MVTKIIIEAVVYSLLYTAFMLILFKSQGATYQLYNYPAAIKDRAIEKGIIIQEELDAHAKKNKVTGMIWFCHGKWWVIPGTEDMTEAYHDYAFHWKWFFLGLLTILPLAAIIGGIVALTGLF